MTKSVKVNVIQKVAAYHEESGNVLREYNSVEEGSMEKVELKAEGISVGPVWMLRTEEGDFLDDAKGCYPSEDEALNHLKEIRYSHSSEPTDTEGHSYDCLHCGIHYYVFDEAEIPVCTVEKAV